MGHWLSMLRLRIFDTDVVHFIMPDESENESNDLKRIRAIRSGNRSVLTRYSREAVQLLAGTIDTTTRERLRTIATLLNEKTTLLKELDAKVLELCDVSEIEREIEETDEIYSRTCDVQRKIEVNTSEHDALRSQVGTPRVVTTNDVNTNSTENNNEQSSLNEASTTAVSSPQIQQLNLPTAQQLPARARAKLPKVGLPKFKGDITEYRTFWETFESAVHNNGELTTIDKFHHLYSLLQGQAQRTIKGLAITADNYQAAIDLLNERFGKTQQIISTYMDELLKIAPCANDKSIQLRFVYDKISVNVRGLA